MMRTAPAPWAVSTVGWILVSLSLSTSSCLAELEKLRQHDHKQSKARGMKGERVRSLAVLWENEALLAQSEADRVLYRWEHVFGSLGKIIGIHLTQANQLQKLLLMY